MRDLNRIIRYLAYTLELLVLFMVQQTPGLTPAIAGVRPVLVLPAAVAMAMFEEEVPAMVFGIVAGLFCDFGYSGTLGYHALVMALVCFFVSVLVRAHLQVNIVTAVLMGGWTMAVAFGGQWLCFYYFRYSMAGYAFSHHYVPKYFYTLLFIPLLYLLNKGLAEALGTNEQ